MLYVFSDPHFGHINILEFEPLRKKILGETIQEHDKVLLQRINLKVRPEDTLVCLGDFSLQSGHAVRNYREQINCKNVILILGNHDKHSVPYYYRCGFSVVCYEMTIKIAKEYVRLRHHPYRKPWWKIIFPWQFKEKDRLKRPIDNGSWLLHGHTHSQQVTKIIGKQINVGVDLNNYYPVSQSQIESIITRTNNIKSKPKRCGTRRTK